MSPVIYCILIGALAGNLIMGVLRNLNLGLLRNTVIGAFGGFIGFSVMSDLSFEARVIVKLAVSFAVGAGLTAVVGALMNLRAR